MKVWSVCLLCLFVGVSSVQAQGWKSVFRFPSLSSKAISVAQRRALVTSYTLKIQRIVALNRLNLPVAQRPVLERSLRMYYKSVSLNFPQISVKPLDGAVNSLEEMALALPASLKEENLFVQTIPNILRPTEAYFSAVLAESWSNLLDNGFGGTAYAEKAVSPSEVKRAKKLQRELSGNFKKLYDALPAEEKDLSAQLSRVMDYVGTKTGWNKEMLEDLEAYFSGVMKPYIAKQNALTAREFLEAYDVLAVAAEVGARYQSRAARGMSVAPQFLINESVQRVKSRIVQSTAREDRLNRWYEGLFGY